MDVRANELVIVTAFGRGQWLAAERARSGQQVTLVDVSEALGQWNPEDWEGPFGFFRTQEGELSASQLERLLEDDIPESLDGGFTLWLKDGPLELKGPLTGHRMEALKINQHVRDYITGFAKETPTENRRRREALGEAPFSEVWLAALAGQLSSTRYYSNRRSLYKGPPLPLFSSFFVRQATRPGYKRSLEWAEQAGVRVISKAKILDLGYESTKILEALEINSPNFSGVVCGKEFVWMLSSLETQTLQSGLEAKLFEDPVVEPQWSWQRFRIGLEPCPEREVLPVHFVFLDSLELPWTHDNLAIINRTYTAESFDVWMRLPYSLRFGRSYLEKIAEDITAKLRKRIPRANAHLQEYPREYQYSFKELGAPRFPVYSDSVTRPRIRAENAIADGPECWPRLDWLSQLSVHRRISKKLEKSYEELLRKDAEL